MLKQNCKWRPITQQKETRSNLLIIINSVCLIFTMSPNKEKKKDIVLIHFRLLSTSHLKSKQYECRFCGYKCVENSTRMTKHLVEMCRFCPPNVKKELSDIAHTINNPALKPTAVNADTRRNLPVFDGSDTENSTESTSTSALVPTQVDMHCTGLCVYDRTYQTKPNNIIILVKLNKAKQPEQLTFFIAQQPSLNDATEHQIDSSQTTVRQINTLSSQEQDIIDQLLARSVFVNNISHQYMECPHFRRFLDRLNPSYKPPSAYIMSNRYVYVSKAG